MLKVYEFFTGDLNDGNALDPLLVRTIPLVPTLATDCIAAVEVVPAHNTAYAVFELTPVPPLLTVNGFANAVNVPAAS